jgi:hypothetical protein
MRNADLVALCHAMCVCVRLAAALILLVPALATAQATISGLETDSTMPRCPQWRWRSRTWRAPGRRRLPGSKRARAA